MERKLCRLLLLAREAAGQNQTPAGKAVGCSKSFVSYYERAEAAVSARPYPGFPGDGSPGDGHVTVTRPSAPHGDVAVALAEHPDLAAGLRRVA